MSNRSWTPIVFGYDSIFAGGDSPGESLPLEPTSRPFGFPAPTH